MRKTLVYLLVISVFAGMVTSCRKNVLPTAEPHPIPLPEEPPKLEETQPPVLTAVTYPISGNIQGYYKGLPARYNESQEKYPVIISLHGGGNYGNGGSDITKVLRDGIPKLLADNKFPPSFTVNGEKFSFIVIAPQFVKLIDNSEVEKLVTFVKDSFRVDPSRIYLTGFSLGARVATEWVATKPSEIAAVTTMGGMPQVDENLEGKCQAMINAKLPVWHFHNKDDSAWYYSESARYIEIFNGLSPAIPARFTSFEVGEARLHHDCWTRATNPDYKEGGKNIYEWMLQYKR
jgi:predicted peptidase